MGKSPILGTDQILQSQSGKNITHNEALFQIESMTYRALSITTSIPATASDGDTYISPSDDKIYSWLNNSFRVFDPIVGLRIYVIDEGALYLYNGSAWEVFVSGGGAADQNLNAYQFENYTTDLNINPTQGKFTLNNDTIGGQYVFRFHYFEARGYDNSPLANSSFFKGIKVGDTFSTIALSGVRPGAPDQIDYLAGEITNITEDTPNSCYIITIDDINVGGGGAINDLVGDYYGLNFVRTGSGTIPFEYTYAATTSPLTGEFHYDGSKLYFNQLMSASGTTINNDNIFSSLSIGDTFLASFRGGEKASFIVASKPTLVGSVYSFSVNYTGNFQSYLDVVGFQLIKSITDTYFYNDTGSIIKAGSILHLKSATIIDGEEYPTFELADASTFDKTQGTLVFAATDVSDTSLGEYCLYCDYLPCDTSTVNAGAQLWLKANPTPGQVNFTDIQPDFPNYIISVGGSYNNQLDGAIIGSITTNVYNTFNSAWVGSIRESFNFTTSSDGVTVTGLLENRDDPTINLTLVFEDLFVFDTTTTPKEVTLFAGTTTAPVTNYVFIPENTKVLTVNTTGFPEGFPHCKIAKCVVGDPVFTQQEGSALKNQNYNDHIKTEGDNGHILHIADRLRQTPGKYESGIDYTFTNIAGSGTLATTGGEVWQLHKQNVEALDMSVSDYIRIVNDPNTAYRRTQDFNTITQYSDGTPIPNNNWFKVVVWLTANNEDDFLMCNIPSAGYNSEVGALNDASNFANYSIPKDFVSNSILVATFVLNNSGGTLTYNGSNQDLRGLIPAIQVGGSVGGGGVTTLLGLTDTPSTFTGSAGKPLIVNPAENSTIFEATTQENIYKVAKSGNAQFNTVANAVAAVTGTSPTNKAVVQIAPTNYAETVLIDVPSNTSIVGVGGFNDSVITRNDEILQVNTSAGNGSIENISTVMTPAVDNKINLRSISTSITEFTIQNCEFTNNVSGDLGSTILSVEGNSILTLNNCVFNYNQTGTNSSTRTHKMLDINIGNLGSVTINDCKFNLSIEDLRDTFVMISNTNAGAFGISSCVFTIEIPNITRLSTAIIRVVDFLQDTNIKVAGVCTVNIIDTSTGNNIIDCFKISAASGEFIINNFIVNVISTNNTNIAFLDTTAGGVADTHNNKINTNIYDRGTNHKGSNNFGDEYNFNMNINVLENNIDITRNSRYLRFEGSNSTPLQEKGNAQFRNNIDELVLQWENTKILSYKDVDILGNDLLNVNSIGNGVNPVEFTGGATFNDESTFITDVLINSVVGLSTGDGDLLLRSSNGRIVKAGPANTALLGGNLGLNGNDIIDGGEGSFNNLTCTDGGNIADAGGAVFFGANVGSDPMGYIKGSLVSNAGGSDRGDVEIWTRRNSDGIYYKNVGFIQDGSTELFGDFDLNGNDIIDVGSGEFSDTVTINSLTNTTSLFLQNNTGIGETGIDLGTSTSGATLSRIASDRTNRVVQGDSDLVFYTTSNSSFNEVLRLNDEKEAVFSGDVDMQGNDLLNVESIGNGANPIAINNYIEAGNRGFTYDGTGASNLNSGIEILSSTDVSINGGGGSFQANTNGLIFQLLGSGEFNVTGIPTSNAGLSAGSFFTQTASEIGGTGTTKVLCIV